MCIWEIISPKGCFPVISTPDAKNAFIKIVILTEYMYNALGSDCGEKHEQEAVSEVCF